MGDKHREFHPVANLFPLLRGEAFAELVADIGKNGLREAILVDRQGFIIDGRNRYRACLEAGVEPRFVVWDGAGSAAAVALSLNLHRRHLDESQRAMVAARLAKLIGPQAATRRRGTLADLQKAGPVNSVQQAAATVNVSPRLTGYAIRVLRDGCEELIAALDAGELAVTTASELSALPKEEQTRAVAGGPPAVAARIREMRGAKAAAEAPSAGFFGILDREEQRGEQRSFLWVASRSLPAAVEALKARGFQPAPPARD